MQQTLLTSSKIFHAGAVILSLAMIQRDRGTASHAHIGNEAFWYAGRRHRPCTDCAVPVPAVPSGLRGAFRPPKAAELDTHGLWLLCVTDYHDLLGRFNTWTEDIMRSSGCVHDGVLCSGAGARDLHACDDLARPNVIMGSDLSTGEVLTSEQYRRLLLPTILHSGAHVAVAIVGITSISAARASGGLIGLLQLLHILATAAGAALVLIPVSVTILTLVEAGMILDGEKVMVSHQGGVVARGSSGYFVPLFRAFRLLNWAKLKSVTVLFAKWWIVLFVASGIAVC